jgi:hypothetical protein
MGYGSTIVCARSLRHKEEYFVKYQDIPLAKPMGGLKYGEHQLYDI